MHFFYVWSIPHMNAATDGVLAILGAFVVGILMTP